MRRRCIWDKQYTRRDSALWRQRESPGHHLLGCWGLGTASSCTLHRQTVSNEQSQHARQSVGCFFCVPVSEFSCISTFGFMSTLWEKPLTRPVIASTICVIGMVQLNLRWHLCLQHSKVIHYKYELLMMTLGMSSCGPNLFLLQCN